MSNKKRILWLLNHTTLREFEVPLLISMGYEVFTPKIFPLNPGNRSASVSYEFDNTLSIPENDLNTLNSFDFYSEKPDAEIIHLINKYFGMAITAYMFPMFDYITELFKWDVLLRAFGLPHKSWNYYKYAIEVSRPGLAKRLAKISDRFWFAAGYENLKSIEPKFIQDRTLYLPVGLPPRVTKMENSWRGGIKKILFVCPDINSYPEAKNAYTLFKSNFGDLPHIICGAQTIPVDNDPNVLGRLSNEEYSKIYQESAVMFHHSESPRHIYYHPAEAICYGMPLIFMEKGMLGEIGGRTYPGVAASYKEARGKLLKILNNDKEYIDSVIETQKNLYKIFSPKFCQEIWKRNFEYHSFQKNRSIEKSIAIIALDNSPFTRLKALSICDLIAKDNTKIFVGLPSDSIENQNINTSKYKVTIRPYAMMEIDAASIYRCNEITGFPSPNLSSECYYLPNDNASQFMDCDCWIIIGSHLNKPIAPVKNFMFIALSNDNEENIKPLSYDAFRETLTNAQMIFTENHSIYTFLSNHLGISKRWLRELNVSLLMNDNKQSQLIDFSE